jgi:hypothetical protein
MTVANLTMWIQCISDGNGHATVSVTVSFYSIWKTVISKNELVMRL